MKVAPMASFSLVCRLPKMTTVCTACLLVDIAALDLLNGTPYPGAYPDRDALHSSSASQTQR